MHKSQEKVSGKGLGPLNARTTCCTATLQGAKVLGFVEMMFSQAFSIATNDMSKRT